MAALVFALTLVVIAVHVGEWILLGQMARASSRGRVLARSPFTRLFGLMNFLRFEAFYYAVLFVFWLLAPGAVPGVAVFLLGAIHIGGWAALESKKTLPQLEAIATIAVQNPEAWAGGARLRGVLGGIAAFDAVEVAVLVYLADRLWPLP